MIHSMTGYSSGRVEAEDFSLAVSLKSFNHRFLDLQIRLPAQLDFLEAQVRRLLKAHVLRGHVELTVTLERPASDSLRIDRKLLASLLRQIQEVKRELNLSSDPEVAGLLRLPGLLVEGGGEIAGPLAERIQQALESLLLDAMAELSQIRAREGEILERDLRARLEKLGELGGNVHQLADRVMASYQRRIEKRLHELVGAHELDPSRVAQEVVFLASRSDIAEEVVRFRSHVEQARGLLERELEVGKKLDFLLQEMNREANTILSKTADVPEVGAEIGRQAIEMKYEVEKLREQAQNIE